MHLLCHQGGPRLTSITAAKTGTYRRIAGQDSLIGSGNPANWWAETAHLTSEHTRTPLSRGWLRVCSQIGTRGGTRWCEVEALAGRRSPCLQASACKNTATEEGFSRTIAREPSGPTWQVGIPTVRMTLSVVVGSMGPHVFALFSRSSRRVGRCRPAFLGAAERFSPTPPGVVSLSRAGPIPCPQGNIRLAIDQTTKACCNRRVGCTSVSG